MVLMAEPILRAVKKIQSKIKGQKSKVIITSPRGKLFTNDEAKKLAKKYKHILFIAGHYEGIDDRVRAVLAAVAGRDELAVEERDTGGFGQRRRGCERL